MKEGNGGILLGLLLLLQQIITKELIKIASLQLVQQLMLLNPEPPIEAPTIS